MENHIINIFIRILLIVRWKTPILTIAKFMTMTVLIFGANVSETFSQPTLIPKELSPNDVALYVKIFEVQESGEWSKADSLISEIENPILLGHVKFQRLMHPTDYRSSFNELENWLKIWSDQPDADRIYRLALRRKPKNSADPQSPTSPVPNGKWNIDFSQRKQDTPSLIYQPIRSDKDSARVKNAFNHVRQHLRKSEVDLALKDLEKGVVINSIFDETERAILSAQIAATAFYNGKDAIALELAKYASEKAKQWRPESDWIAGLAAWNMNLYETARIHFELAVTSGFLGDREHAGAAYWAARANVAVRNAENVLPWLIEASSKPYTLYGQLAARQLGQESPIKFLLPELNNKQIENILDIAAVRRAIALSQAGQHYWADREIRTVFSKGGIGIAPALLTVAGQYGIAASTLYIGRMLSNYSGVDYAGGLYPLAPWEPESGFSIDKALLHAFMRKESAFNTNARSVDGARGLMQLLPSTASFITQDASLMRQNLKLLYLPEKSLDLGQMYIHHLMEMDDFRNNLIMVISAYNGGPGNLGRWIGRMGVVTDPLIFIEKIPVRETREFVASIFSNLWIYRARMGQDSPTLDAMAVNKWPIYKSIDKIQ